MPGELMGLDGIASGQYQCDMIALSYAHVCQLSYRDFEQVVEKFPVLRQEILSISSINMTTAQKMLMFIGKRPVEERLAMFLISISQRFKARGLSESRFQLPMSRQDIANYLGMAPETISRQFKKLQDQGLVSIQNRDLTINNTAALRGTITSRGSELD